MATQADFDRARGRLRALAQTWRTQPWYEALVSAASGPIAHEAQALADVLEAGDPGGALLQLRDTVETLVKFCALAFACDLMAQGPADKAARARKLLLSRALSLGAWWSAARDMSALVATEPVVSSSRALVTPFQSPALRGALDRFVTARNDEIGHGAFRRDPNEAVDVVEQVTLGANDGAAFIFSCFDKLSWPRLYAEEGGRRVDLAGAAAIRAWHHEHPPGADHDETCWRTWLEADGCVSIDLSPFVAARICGHCGHRDVFLFDTLRDAKSAKSDFLDYVQGHKFRAPDAQIAGNLSQIEGLDPELLSSALDRGPLSRLAMEALETASNDTRYRSPAYLRDPLFENIAQTTRSVTWLQAPAHVGKSVFARGLADPLAEDRDPPPSDQFHDLAVVGVFIKREWRSDLALLRNRLTDALLAALAINPDYRDLLPTLDPQVKDKPGRFVELLAEAMRQRGDPRHVRLLVVIDGLDELEPSERARRFWTSSRAWIDCRTAFICC